MTAMKRENISSSALGVQSNLDYQSTLFLVVVFHCQSSLFFCYHHPAATSPVLGIEKGEDAWRWSLDRRKKVFDLVSFRRTTDSIYDLAGENFADNLISKSVCVILFFKKKIVCVFANHIILVISLYKIFGLSRGHGPAEPFLFLLFLIEML